MPAPDDEPEQRGTSARGDEAEELLLTRAGYEPSALPTSLVLPSAGTGGWGVPERTRRGPAGEAEASEDEATGEGRGHKEASIGHPG